MCTGLHDFWLASAFGVALALVTGLLVERLVVRPLKGNWWNTKAVSCCDRGMRRRCLRVRRCAKCCGP